MQKAVALARTFAVPICSTDITPIPEPGGDSHVSKNTWYVACTPDEIAAKPLGRKICGEKIVFYRGAGDKVAAVEDFCPHRGAPLSLGFVRDGELVCGYHGLEWVATAK